MQAKRFTPAVAAITLVCGICSAQAITGHVYSDANFNGIREAGEVGVPNVPVTDGSHFVQTDSSGFYQITVSSSSDPQLADGGWPVVSVSWPSGKWPTGPWWKNTEQIGAGNTLDFGLRDNQQSVPFTFVHATDPHVWQGGLDKFPLLRSDVNDMSGWIKFIFLTGDLARAPDIDPPATVKPELLFFEQYTEDYPAQLFYTSGNHDIVGVMNVEWDPNDADYGYGWYTREVGPLRYSFNYAGIHFVGIDWMTRTENGSWYANVPDITVDWLTEDLSLVPQGTRILLFMLYPVTITSLVQSRGVEHIFAGHTHCITSFTFGGATVTLGGSTSQICPADKYQYPLGYDIVHVTENDVTTDYRALGNPYIQDIDGDFDNDGDVDLLDLQLLADNWLASHASCRDGWCDAGTCAWLGMNWLDGTHHDPPLPTTL